MLPEAAVWTIEAFRELDDGRILEGFMDGFEGDPPAEHSPSYLHGWRNGMIESGRAEPDQAFRALEREFASLRSSN